jgi:hypothetical protein
VKSKGKRSEPESGSSDEAAPQIADNDAAAGDSIQFSHERDCVVFRKVMQNLGREDDVNARISKRQG